MKKIKRISEAYSMQPYSKSVDYGSRYDFEVNKPPITEIKFEEDYCNGYDRDGNILFSWVANAVNIDYFIEGEWQELRIKGDDELPI